MAMIVEFEGFAEDLHIMGRFDAECVLSLKSIGPGEKITGRLIVDYDTRKPLPFLFLRTFKITVETL